jgi:hypothetical protein
MMVEISGLKKEDKTENEEHKRVRKCKREQE